MSLFRTTIKGRWSASSSADHWRVRLEFSVVGELTRVLSFGGSRNYRDSSFRVVDLCKSFEEMRVVRKDRPPTVLDDWQGREFVRSKWEYHDGSLIVCTFFPPREGKYPNRCCTKDHWRTKQIKFIRIRSFQTQQFEKKSIISALEKSFKAPRPPNRFVSEAIKCWKWIEEDRRSIDRVVAERCRDPRRLSKPTSVELCTTSRWNTSRNNRGDDFHVSTTNRCNQKRRGALMWEGQNEQIEMRDVLWEFLYNRISIP